jgi:hypothetical protein
LYETRYSPSTTTAVFGSAPYRLNTGRVVAQTKVGRIRIAGSGAYTNYNFLPAKVAGGGLVNQDNRDRNVVTLDGLLEYAISPDTSVFAQIDYDHSDYRTLLSPGVANRDSDTIRVLAGVSLDITSLIRGRIGIGYIDRKYQSPIYKDLKGFSADINLEYFPSALTTLGLSVKRRVDDAGIGVSGGYVSTAGALKVDHELLRNVLVNARVSYEIGDYKDVNSKAKIFRTGIGANYMMSRLLSLKADVSYGERKNSGSALLGPSFNETRGQLTLALRL